METKKFQKPFFAQFLEGERAQAQQAESTKPSADTVHTDKYPSDGDEDWPADLVS